MSDLEDTRCQELAAKVVEYVKENPGTSFIELEEFLEEEIDVEGKAAWETNEVSNMFLWFGMSPEFIDVLHEATATGEIHMRPCEPFIYHVDGKVPNYDVAKQPPADGYKSERWAPAAFYPGSGENGSE